MSGLGFKLLFALRDRPNMLVRAFVVLSKANEYDSPFLLNLRPNHANSARSAFFYNTMRVPLTSHGQ